MEVTKDTGIYMHPIAFAGFVVVGYFEYFGSQYYFYILNALELVKTIMIIFTLLGTYFLELINIDAVTEGTIIIIITSFLLGILLYKFQQQRIASVVENVSFIGSDKTSSINSMIQLSGLVDQTQNESEIFWIFIGLLLSHRDSCRKSNCQCEELEASLRSLNNEGGKVKNENENEEAKNEVIVNNSNLIEQGAKMIELWRSFFTILLDTLVDRYPKSIDVKILVAY